MIHKLSFFGLLFALLTILLPACRMKSEYEDRFNSFRKVVSDSVFYNFPVDDSLRARATTVEILYPEMMFASGYSGCFWTYKLDATHFNTLFLKLEKAAIKRTSFSDACVQQISRIDSMRVNQCSDLPIVVPSTDDPFLDSYLSPENVDAVLVFASGKGSFAASQPLHEAKPIGIKEHGFSNGAFISQSTYTIFFWAMVW